MTTDADTRGVIGEPLMPDGTTMKRNNTRFRFRLTIKTFICATAAAACFCAAWVVGANPNATSLQKTAVLIGWPVAVLLAFYYSTFAEKHGREGSHAGGNHATSSARAAENDSAMRRILRRIRFGAIVGFVAMPATFLLALPFFSATSEASHVQDLLDDLQRPETLLRLLGGLVAWGLMGAAFGATVSFVYAGIVELLRGQN